MRAGGCWHFQAFISLANSPNAGGPRSELEVDKLELQIWYKSEINIETLTCGTDMVLLGPLFFWGFITQSVTIGGRLWALTHGSISLLTLADYCHHFAEPNFILTFGIMAGTCSSALYKSIHTVIKGRYKAEKFRVQSSTAAERIELKLLKNAEWNFK